MKSGSSSVSRARASSVSCEEGENKERRIIRVIAESPLFFFCSHSETHEQQYTGSNGAKHVVFDVSACTHQFQTRQRKPRGNHEEHAKGFKRSASRTLKSQRSSGQECTQTFSLRRWASSAAFSLCPSWKGMFRKGIYIYRSDWFQTRLGSLYKL